MNFEFKCPQCGQMVETDESYRGQVAECPCCGKGIVIPRDKLKVHTEQKERLIHAHGQLRNMVEPNKECYKSVVEDDTGSLKEWFYHPKSGPDIGPLAIHELRGRITRETLIWKNGMVEWTKAGNLPELTSILAGMKPPLPPTIISDKWMWCLSIIPIVACWTFSILVHDAVGFVVAVVLNTIFVILDFKEIDKSGRDVSTACYLWGLLFVPGYMFYRAAKYSKRYAPAIIWCVLLVLPLMIFMLLFSLVAVSAVQ